MKQFPLKFSVNFQLRHKPTFYFKSYNWAAVLLQGNLAPKHILNKKVKEIVFERL